MSSDRPLQRKEAARRSRGLLSLRVVLVSIIIIPLNAWWITEIEYVRYSDNATTQAIFFNAVTLLLALMGLNVLLRRLGPRWMLTTQEILALYVIVAVASNLAGHDQLQILFTTLTYVFRHATPETGWATKILPHLPAHLVVSDKDVIDPLFTGNSTLYRPDHILPWLKPLGWWTLFVMAVVWTMLCLASLFRRQWDYERLNYPIAEIPIQVLSRPQSLFGSRLLWGGAAIGAAGQIINLIHSLYPSIPGVPIGVQYFQAQAYPWNAAGPLPISSFPFAYGLTFLLPTQLGFSCWFFMLFSRVELIVAAMMGYTEWGKFPYVQQQGVGAILGVALAVLYTARGHLAHAWRCTWRTDPLPGPPPGRGRGYEDGRIDPLPDPPPGKGRGYEDGRSDPLPGPPPGKGRGYEDGRSDPFPDPPPGKGRGYEDGRSDPLPGPPPGKGRGFEDGRSDHLPDPPPGKGRGYEDGRTDPLPDPPPGRRMGYEDGRTDPLCDHLHGTGRGYGDGERDANEPMSYRTAVLGLIAGSAGMVWFAMAAGMRWQTAMLYLGILFVIVLVVARLRAELGLPTYELYQVGADQVLQRVSGTAAWTRGDLTVMTLFFWLSRTHRQFPMQTQVDAIRIGHRTGVRLSSLTLLILLASLLGTVAAFWAYLHTMYQVGFESAKFRGPAIWAFGSEPWQKLDSWISSPQRADPGTMGAYAFGCLFTLFLAAMRVRFLWWPFHPAGYLVAGSFGLFRLWLPIFVSWLVKVLLLRYGGLRAYRQALPFFIGLILGEFVTGFARTVLDMALGLHLPPESGIGGL